MILALDVGNTHTHLGLFHGEKLQSSWKLSTDPRRTVDEYALQLRGLLGPESKLEGAIICSVVPRLTAKLNDAMATLEVQNIMVLTSETEIGLINGYLHPAEVGMDRLADAVGGNLYYGPPLLILDYGTAITLEYLAEPEPGSDLPVYRGGAIIPGIELAAAALARGTAQLPTIDITAGAKVIGRTTAESIRSGLIHGHLGAVEALVHAARKEIGSDCRVVSTGGDAVRFKDRMPYLHAVAPDLTLYGLRHIYGLNHNCPLPKP